MSPERSHEGLKIRHFSIYAIYFSGANEKIWNTKNIKQIHGRTLRKELETWKHRKKDSKNV